MIGNALKWHARLDSETRASWAKLEQALLCYSSEPPSYVAGGTTATSSRAAVERLGQEVSPPASFPRSENEWLDAAEERRQLYEKAGRVLQAPVQWLLVRAGEDVPDIAIQTGVDTCGETLYTARAWLAGGLHPGKCGRHLDGEPTIRISELGIDSRISIEGAHIAHGEEEYGSIAVYEVLVGDVAAIRWVGASFTVSAMLSEPPIQMKQIDALEGGMDADGTPLLLAQTYREGFGWQPAKVNMRLGTCEFGWGYQSFTASECRILVWA